MLCFLSQRAHLLFTAFFYICIYIYMAIPVLVIHYITGACELGAVKVVVVVVGGLCEKLEMLNKRKKKNLKHTAGAASSTMAACAFYQ